MPINRLLLNIDLTPEKRHILQLAFNQPLTKLHLVDRNDPLCDLVARKIIDIGARGASNAVAVSEIAIRELGLPNGRN